MRNLSVDIEEENAEGQSKGKQQSDSNMRKQQYTLNQIAAVVEVSLNKSRKC
ncbi:MAG: hypothetical protein ACLU48_02020 [Clostridiaceae bacterium]